MSRERAPHSQLLQNSSEFRPYAWAVPRLAALGAEAAAELLAGAREGRAACINWSAVRWNQTAGRKYEQGPRAAVTAILVLLGGMCRWKGAPRRSQ